MRMKQKLRPRTSLVVVKLALFVQYHVYYPPKIMILFFLSTIHFPDKPYLNLSSSKPWAVYPCNLQGSFGPKYVLPPAHKRIPSTSLCQN
jgi:hypothetical protein